ncbi:UNVERIFIED_CONTAM: hypothetical protein K2H54_002629 [Gekko kuhli]
MQKLSMCPSCCFPALSPPSSHVPSAEGQRSGRRGEMSPFPCSGAEPAVLLRQEERPGQRVRRAQNSPSPWLWSFPGTLTRSAALPSAALLALWPSPLGAGKEPPSSALVARHAESCWVTHMGSAQQECATV